MAYFVIMMDHDHHRMSMDSYLATDRDDDLRLMCHRSGQ